MQTDDALRNSLKQKLSAGLETEVEPRAYTHEAVMEIVARLQAAPRDDYEAKLVIAGFKPAPYCDGEDRQACETCMYYRVHQRFCELPELMLPVEGRWSCRLWRI